jgi:hypothetical protein
MDATRHGIAKAIAISILLFASTFVAFLATLGADPTDKFLAWTYSFPCGQPTEAACARMLSEAATLRAAKQPCSYVLVQGLQQCRTLLARNTDPSAPAAR